MRFLPTFARLTLAAAAVVAPSVLSAPTAEGALLPAARHAHRLTCEPSTLPRAERARLKKLTSAERTILRDVAASLERGGTASLDDGVAAIQSDAPAVPLDTGWRATPLQPIGLLVGSHSALPRLRSFSRRSPRGPPFR